MKSFNEFSLHLLKATLELTLALLMNGFVQIGNRYKDYPGYFIHE